MDVPKPPSLMMIPRNAERLGCHSSSAWRGRVGRGVIISLCLALQAAAGPSAEARLNVIAREPPNGFVIAEKVWNCAVPELLGTTPDGMLRFRIADLARDARSADPVKTLAGNSIARRPM